MQERLQKIISACGAASRRQAEKMIVEGRVTVNGITASIGDKADVETDEILLDGVKLKNTDAKRYIMLNKPVGYVTTMKDEKGRKNVSDLVADVGGRVYPVGRLDLNSEGLLIMTNDGAFANHVMHPSSEKQKTYNVTVSGALENIERLSEPMEIDGYMIRPAEVKRLFCNETGTTLEIKIHEGRNRQIRKMCAMVGLDVKKLKRVAVGDISLGALKSGHWRDMTESEIASLLK